MFLHMKNYIYMAFGAFLIAFGVVGFFANNAITTGGSPGLALLLYHLTGLSLGSLIALINIPLLLWAFKYLGKSFVIQSIITIFLISSFTDFLHEIIHLQNITQELVLATLFGGAIIGIGLGFILKANSSAGGSSIVAKILALHYGLKPANVILAIDAAIILGSIYIFGDIQIALWSILSIIATSKAIDISLSGGVKQKVVHITSSKTDELASHITTKLRKEGTILEGVDLFKNGQKHIIFIIVPLSRLNLLRQIIAEVDSEAAMVVMDAVELQGR